MWPGLRRLFFLSVRSRSVQATSLAFKENERVTGIFRRYTRWPGLRLTHTLSNVEKFYLIYLFLTNTILNLYLSVAAPGFCLGEPDLFCKCCKIKNTTKYAEYYRVKFNRRAELNAKMSITSS